MLLEHAFYQQFLNGRSIADTKEYEWRIDRV